MYILHTDTLALHGATHVWNTDTAAAFLMAGQQVLVYSQEKSRVCVRQGKRELLHAHTQAL